MEPGIQTHIGCKEGLYQQRLLLNQVVEFIVVGSGCSPSLMQSSMRSIMSFRLTCSVLLNTFLRKLVGFGLNEGVGEHLSFPICQRSWSPICGWET